MKQKSNARLINKNNFNQTCNGKIQSKEEKLFQKSLFLLNFDYDPNAQKEGLEILRKLAKKKYQPALTEINNIKNNKLYMNARRMFSFVYGYDVI